MLSNFSFILAQSGSSGAPPAGGGMQLIILMLPLILIFYFMVFRPQSRERKQHQAMIAAIKKNDRVVTAGGIIGTVTSVRDDEITLKVDESSNTKITFRRGSVQQVLSAAPEKSADEKSGA